MMNEITDDAMRGGLLSLLVAAATEKKEAFLPAIKQYILHKINDSLLGRWESDYGKLTRTSFSDGKLKMSFHPDGLPTMLFWALAQCYDQPVVALRMYPTNPAYLRHVYGPFSLVDNSPEDKAVCMAMLKHVIGDWDLGPWHTQVDEVFYKSLCEKDVT